MYDVADIPEMISGAVRVGGVHCTGYFTNCYWDLTGCFPFEGRSWEGVDVTFIMWLSYDG